MPSLREAQAAFARALDAPAPSAAGLRAYRANLWGNWAAALAGAYPIVRKIVGDEFFHALAREYARAHPSTSGDLNEYGAGLADFVAAFAHTRDLPYLSDVARMEWLAHRAYYAADRGPGLLSPACALLQSEWPLARLWEVHQDGYDGEFAVDLGAGPECILVHRPRWRVEVHALAPGDHAFLEALAQGAGLAPALEAALREDAGFDPMRAPTHWLKTGVLTL